MNPSLSSCPFCGEAPEVMEDENYCQCINSECPIWFAGFKLDLWNRRASLWRPISEAPTETPILVRWHPMIRYPSQAVAWVEENEWMTDGGKEHMAPIEFQPLPPPPEGWEGK